VEHSQKRWETEGRRDDLLLAEGLQLEEGLSLLHDAPRLVAGAEYARTRDYVAASDASLKARQAAAEADRQRQETEKENLRQKELAATQQAAANAEQAARNARKAARNARAGLVVAAVLLVLTAGAAWFAAENQREAEVEKDRAEAETTKARIQAGKGFLLRAENHRLSSDSAFYAGERLGLWDWVSPRVFHSLQCLKTRLERGPCDRQRRSVLPFSSSQCWRQKKLQRPIGSWTRRQRAPFSGVLPSATSIQVS